MKTALTLLGACLLVQQAAPAPQQLDTGLIAELFGDGARQGEGGYGGVAADQASVDAAQDAVDVVVQVVKENVVADYVETDANNYDKATVEVNANFETCAEYKDKFGYECVPYYQCHNGTIITDGAGLIDIRGGFGSLNPEDSKCPGFLDVCCKNPDFVPPPPPKIVHKPKCGRRNNNGIGARIAGFTDGESQFGEWPHMCAVLHDKKLESGDSANLYKCGGSLIAPGVILTAAHCVKDFKPYPEQVKVRCGEWDTQHQTEPYAHQDRLGAHIEIHPQFDGRNLANDFALIFLTEEFNLDFHIDTVCLPQPDESYEYNKCFATGWGKDKFGAEGDYQVVLKEVDLDVVNNVDCQKSLQGTILGKRFKLDESFMCALGKDGKDTCKGDGGSPLVCPRKSDPSRFDQAGIVAWGIGCSNDDVPGVYASVAKGACWIDLAMTCYFNGKGGKYESFWGYSDAQCGTWLDQTYQALDKKIEGAGKFASIFEKQKAAFGECTVNWKQNNNGGGGYVENLEVEGLDLEAFERDGTYSAGTSEVKISEDSYSADKAPQAYDDVVVEVVEVAKEAVDTY